MLNIFVSDSIFLSESASFTLLLFMNVFEKVDVDLYSKELLWPIGGYKLREFGTILDVSESDMIEWIRVFEPKTPYDETYYGFDFTPYLKQDVIVGVDVRVLNEDKLDVTNEFLDTDKQVVDEGVVYFWVRGKVEGLYNINCKVLTSTGRVKEWDASIRVIGLKVKFL